MAMMPMPHEVLLPPRRGRWPVSCHQQRLVSAIRMRGPSCGPCIPCLTSLSFSALAGRLLVACESFLGVERRGLAD